MLIDGVGRGHGAEGKSGAKTWRPTVRWSRRQWRHRYRTHWSSATYDVGMIASPIDRVGSIVAVAAPVEQVWRAVLIVLGAEADVPGVRVVFGALTGRVREVVVQDHLVLQARLGERTYEVAAHLMQRGASCELAVYAVPDDVTKVPERGWWRRHLERRRVRRVVRTLATDVARAAGDAPEAIPR